MDELWEERWLWWLAYGLGTGVSAGLLGLWIWLCWVLGGCCWGGWPSELAMRVSEASHKPLRRSRLPGKHIKAFGDHYQLEDLPREFQRVSEEFRRCQHELLCFDFWVNVREPREPYFDLALLLPFHKLHGMGLARIMTWNHLEDTAYDTVAPQNTQAALPTDSQNALLPNHNRRASNSRFSHQPSQTLYANQGKTATLCSGNESPPQPLTYLVSAGGTGTAHQLESQKVQPKESASRVSVAKETAREMTKTFVVSTSPASFSTPSSSPRTSSISPKPTSTSTHPDLSRQDPSNFSSY